MKNKTYTGSCYIAVVGGEIEYGLANDSIDGIAKRPGDTGPIPARGTKGYEVRQMHWDHWLEETKHPFILLLDHDMTFPSFTLERLRSHGLPYVSGYYMRRQYNPIAPVWFKPWKGCFPYEPWLDEPERGRLHKIGASGWGCILVHRDVALAVEDLLKGEQAIIEDDMDVWPYDLEQVMEAINGLWDLVEDKPKVSILRPALEHYATILKEEIRPLRGVNTIVGSDIRFPYFAMKAGYQLYGDPDLRLGHMVFYPIHGDDFSAMWEANEPGVMTNFDKSRKECNKERRQIRKHLNKLKGRMTT